MRTMSRVEGAGGLWSRIERYKVSKSALALSCIVSIVATVVIGFGWGGWVTAGSVAAKVDSAAINGQAKLAAAICADRFITGPRATAQTTMLVNIESSRRPEFLKQGGWLALPGMNDPVVGAAELCLQKILNATSLLKRRGDPG
jgi:hypothetical protein